MPDCCNNNFTPLENIPASQVLTDCQRTKQCLFGNVDPFTGNGLKDVRVNAAGTLLELFTSTGAAVLLGTRYKFVAQTGNDATAVAGDLTKPYLTITAANTAAVSGDTVMIFGKMTAYNESITIKDGVTYLAMGRVNIKYDPVVAD